MQKLNVSELMAVTAGRGKPDKAPESKSPASSSKGSRGEDRNTGNTSSNSGNGGSCSGGFSWGRESSFSFGCRW